MARVRCMVRECLHYWKGWCNITEDTILDINDKGICDDMTEVTDEEYKLITGRERE